MADWTQLPFELLLEIVMRLESIEDLVYFSIVCRLWNHIATTVKQKFRVKTMPWLLLAENKKENPACLRKVFNPINNKCYQLKLPETFGCRCWGSAYGWIVTFNYDLELHLFNPLTKARMSLPPITCLPYQWGPYASSANYPNFDMDATLQEMRILYIDKAFVLKVAEDDFITCITYLFSRRKLAFARPSDKSWTFIDEPVRMEKILLDSSHEVVDVACHGARILILYGDASLGFLDISDLSKPEKFIVKDYRPKFPVILSSQRNLGIKAISYVPIPLRILKGYSEMPGLYLVDSCGDTFMILRDRSIYEEVEDQDRDQDKDDDEDDAFDYETLGFKVYQLDFNTKNWSQVHDLGNVAIFIGNSPAMLVRGIEAKIAAGDRKSTRIYFTDDWSDCWDAKTLSPAGKDMGVFDLGNGKQEAIYEGSDKYSKFQTPLWFMPQF